MKEYKLNQIEYKRILGRNIKGAGETDEPLALFWGASALEFSVNAKEVWIQVSADYETSEPWIAVEINEYQTERFMVTKGSPYWVCVARNLNPQKKNLISIIKDTQPMSGEAKHSLLIHGVGLDEEGTFAEPKKRSLKIEFIGDSITSGEGLAGNPDEMEWITQWFCASKTYGRQVSRYLDADWSMFSQCGWGICWGWDGNTNSVMPAHYDNVCSVMWGPLQEKLGAKEKYDFSFNPDFVVLNLGTNDNGAFFQQPWKDEKGIEHILHVDENKKACKEDGMIVAEGVKEFLKNIRKHNKKASIVWTWGMIKLVAIPEYILLGIEEYKKETGDEKVYALELPAMEDVEKLPEDKGSRGHPGPKTHKLAAERLFEFLSAIKDAKVIE